MGTPQKVIDAERAEEQANGATDIAENSTPAPEATGKPVLDLTGESDDETRADQRLRSLSGRLRTVSDERDSYAKRIQELEQALRAKDADIEDLRKKANTASLAGEISPDEIKSLTETLNAKTGSRYSEKDVAAFATVVDAVSARTSRRKDADEDTEARIKALEERQTATARKNFTKELEKRFPGFIELNNSGDPRWVKFLDSSLPPPASHIKYRALADEAMRSWDSSAFAEIVEAFAAANGIVFSSQQPASPEAFVRPASAAAPIPRQSAAKPVLPKSFCDRFARSYNARTLSRDFPKIPAKDADAWMEAIEDAEMEGRIDPSR